MQDQRPRLEDFTIKRVALGLPPEIAEVTGRSERSGPDTYPIRDLNQLSRPHAVNQWVTRSPRNDTPPPRWGRILYARYGGSAAGPAEMPERKCDHLNWPRFGLLSSRISARLVVISPDGWRRIGNCGPTPGSDRHVVVVGVEVGDGEVVCGAVRADQAELAGRGIIDPGTGGPASCAPVDRAAGPGQRGPAAEGVPAAAPAGRSARTRPSSTGGCWRTGPCPASSGTRPAGSGSGWSASTARAWSHSGQRISQPVAQTTRGSTRPQYLGFLSPNRPRSSGTRALIGVCGTG